MGLGAEKSWFSTGAGHLCPDPRSDWLGLSMCQVYEVLKSMAIVNGEETVFSKWTYAVKFIEGFKTNAAMEFGVRMLHDVFMQQQPHVANSKLRETLEQSGGKGVSEVAALLNFKYDLIAGMVQDSLGGGGGQDAPCLGLYVHRSRREHRATPRTVSRTRKYEGSKQNVQQHVLRNRSPIALTVRRKLLK